MAKIDINLTTEEMFTIRIALKILSNSCAIQIENKDYKTEDDLKLLKNLESSSKELYNKLSSDKNN